MPLTAATLPQLDRLFLTDSGIETTLVFHDGRDLPAFACFPLLDSAEGQDWFTAYYGRHLAIAAERGLGFILDTPTWRANPDWGASLGYDAAGLARINRAAVALCQEIRAAWAARVPQIVVSGLIGPRGDGYQAGQMTADEAEAYHAPQIAAFAAAGADMVAALTLSTVGEATGITRAAKAQGIPAAISFTVETDGRLASGGGLAEAIVAVDAATGAGPAYYMINCAHPAHFAALFEGAPGALARIRGIRANASRQSHAELDNAVTLDAGDPADLAARYHALQHARPGLTVLGGCCGTDHRHIEAIAAACGGVH